MKKACLLFVLMVNLITCYAQVNSIKNLRKQLPFVHDSLLYIDALNRIGMLFYESNIDSTFYYSMKAREIANRLNYIKGKADALNNLGIVYDMKGDLQMSLRYYNEAYNKYKSIQDAASMVQSTMNIAMVYDEIGKPQKSIDSFNEAFAVGKTLKNDSIMSLALYNYILIYPENIHKDSLLIFIRRAKAIAKKYKDTRVLLAIAQIRAAYAIKHGQLEKGVALLQKTLNLTKSYNLYYLSMDMIMDLGDVYAGSDSAEAVKNYNEGLTIATDKGYHVYSKLFVNKLYNFYTSKKDNAKAYYYSQQLVKLYVQQEKMNNNSSIDYIEYALKDQQLESVRIRSKYQSGFLLLAIVVCMMTIVIIIILWRNWKHTQKTAEALRLQFVHSESTMEALDVMNKDYAKLIKIVAHDLRNPIGAISSITAMIPKDSLNEEVKEMVELLRISSNNCLELINELMKTDFDQQQNLKKEVININDLLQQSVLLLSFKAKDKSQQILLNNADVLLNNTNSILIEGDTEKLLRVLNNLIVNAMKFSQPESEIIISCKFSESDVIIDIKDNGVGIPFGLQDKLFDPFTSSKRTGTSGEHAFGLGLYISKQIVEAHRGKIWFESEDGAGSTFHVSLPIK